MLVFLLFAIYEGVLDGGKVDGDAGGGFGRGASSFPFIEASFKSSAIGDVELNLA